MNELKLTAQGEGYAAGTCGNLSTFSGKVFVKECLGSTGAEISVGQLQAGEALPFTHHHKQNEEIYLVLSGTCVFTLDGHDVEAGSGTVVRVSPTVKRTLRNTGNEPLVYVCIQARKDSLQQYTMTDGVID